MDIHRNASEPSSKGPDPFFRGQARIDLRFAGRAHAAVWGSPLRAEGR